jgi:hypothetical protein
MSAFGGKADRGNFYSTFVKSGHRADHFRLNGNLDPALPRDRFIATQ